MASVNRAKVIELMGRKGITTFKELAQALGLSTTQVSNILSDKFDPVKSNVREIAEFLGVSPLELITDRTERTEANNENSKSRT